MEMDRNLKKKNGIFLSSEIASKVKILISAGLFLSINSKRSVIVAHGLNPGVSVVCLV